MAEPVILAFDLYGTLVSPSSIAQSLAAYLGDESAANSVAATWRTLQLEYTWRLNSMQSFEPFSTVTARALQHALRSHGHGAADAATVERLMAAYDALGTFPDVHPALQALASNPRFRCVVFSNGTPSMVEKSVHGSSALGSHAALFQHLISTDEVRRYKPDPAVYRHLAKRVGMRGQEHRVWLISGNPFDVVGARAVGMQAAWVNRGARAWEDALEEGPIGRPSIEVGGLDEVTRKIDIYLQQGVQRQ